MLPRGSTELWSVLENSMMMEEVLLVFHNQAINGGSTKFFWQLWGTFMMKTMIISPTKSFWEASAVYSFLLSLQACFYIQSNVKSQINLLSFSFGADLGIRVVLKMFAIILKYLFFYFFTGKTNTNQSFCVSDRPKQCFTVLPKPNRTSLLKFCFPNQNRTEPNM